MDIGKLLRDEKAKLECDFALAIAERDKLVDQLIEVRVDLRDVERRLAALDKPKD